MEPEVAANVQLKETLADAKEGMKRVADIVTDLHRWHRWRGFMRSLPIAVLARPRYMGAALVSPAMVWARRWRRPTGSARDWTRWTLPAIIVLDIRQTALSATAIRAAEPNWAARHDGI